jgi:hypothetical protein
MERLAPTVGKEGGPAEQGREQLEDVRAPDGIVGEGVGPLVEQIGSAARAIEHLPEIDLEKVLRDRQGALEVEPPVAAVGEDAPAQAAGGHVVHPAQVAQHLRGGHAVLALAAGVLAIENPVPALRLDDAEPMPEAPPRIERRRVRLRFGAAEQQRVGNVVARLGRQVLLHRHVGPSDRLQQRPDELLLGLRLRRVLQLAEGGQERLDAGLDAREGALVQSAPSGGASDPLDQEVAREKSTVEQASIPPRSRRDEVSRSRRGLRSAPHPLAGESGPASRSAG